MYRLERSLGLLLQRASWNSNPLPKASKMLVARKCKQTRRLSWLNLAML